MVRLHTRPVCYLLFFWCCFYYMVRNSLVALLEALCARIFSLDLWICVFPALFRCNLTVIFVTHKSMMTIPTQTVWTPPWYATIPDLQRVHAVPAFLKIWWWCIHNFESVRIHFFMCLPCFLMRWSVTCCQDGCIIGSSKAHCKKSISFTIWWSRSFVWFSIAKLTGSLRSLSIKSRIVLPLPPSKTNTSYKAWRAKYATDVVFVVSRDASQPVNL